MIDWEQLLVAVPLVLPEIITVAVTVGLTVRLPRRDGTLLAWIVLPAAILGCSSAIRFVPIFVRPVRDTVDVLFGNAPAGLMVVWYGDMILRSIAWSALIYGLFWKLPRTRHAPLLGSESRQTAETATTPVAVQEDARGI